MNCRIFVIDPIKVNHFRFKFMKWHKPIWWMDILPVCCLKVYINSDIPLEYVETAAIFFSREALSKTVYYLGVCHGWFDLHWITGPVRSAIREFQNEQFLSSVEFEPGTFRLGNKVIKPCATRSAIYLALICWPRFTWVYYLNLNVACGRCNRIILVYFCYITFVSFCYLTNKTFAEYEEKKDEIWLSPMTKAPTPTEKSKKQRANTKSPPKYSISQRLRADLGQSSWSNDSHPTDVV